jgi:hypothetical protein
VRRSLNEGQTLLLLLKVNLILLLNIFLQMQHAHCLLQFSRKLLLLLPEHLDLRLQLSLGILRSARSTVAIQEGKLRPDGFISSPHGEIGHCLRVKL